MSDERPMVRVTWRDTGMQFPQEWQHVEDYVAKLRGQSSLAHTVGYLMHASDDVYLIGLSYDPDNGTYYGCQAIDAKAITQIEHLRVAGTVLT